MLSSSNVNNKRPHSNTPNGGGGPGSAMDFVLTGADRGVSRATSGPASSAGGAFTGGGPTAAGGFASSGAGGSSSSAWQPRYVIRMPPPSAATALAPLATTTATAFPHAATTAATAAPSAANSLAPGASGAVQPRPNKKRAEEYTVDDLNRVVSAAPGSTDNEMPDYSALKTLEPNVDLGAELEAFFDAPSAPTQLTNPNAPRAATMPVAAPAMSTADRELLSLFRALEQKARNEATDANSKLYEAAKRLTDVLSFSGQLPGFQHLEEFTADQDLYSKRQRAVERSAGARPTGIKGKIAELSDISKDIIKNAMLRARWVLEVEKKSASKQNDGKTLERVLGVLLKDTKWMSDTAAFVKSVEQQISTLMDNPAFARFRVLLSRGVEWPHSPHLRRHIEQAGFKFRARVFERDRCVCDACGVEVFGWRTWHNPWLFHDWSKRHPFAPPPGTLSRNTTTTAAGAGGGVTRSANG